MGAVGVLIIGATLGWPGLKLGVWSVLLDCVTVSRCTTRADEPFTSTSAMEPAKAPVLGSSNNSMGEPACAKKIGAAVRSPDRVPSGRAKTSVPGFSSWRLPVAVTISVAPS